MGQRVKLLVVCLLSLFVAKLSGAADVSPPKVQMPPNIIVMMVDDMGIGDASPYLGKTLGPSAAPITKTLPVDNGE